MKSPNASDAITLRNYSAALLRPDIWIARAEDLLRAAEKLRPEVEADYQRGFGAEGFINRDRGFHSQGYMPTYFMLLAFALEDLLKAALIRRDLEQLRDRVASTGKLPRKLSTHDLFALMTELGVEPSDWFEEILVRRLIRAATWFGRYPIPVTFREYNTVRYSDGKEYSLPHAASDDFTNIPRLIDRIRTTLKV